MINEPVDVLGLFPIRKSKRQKEAFRESTQAYVEKLGYKCTFEKTACGGKNIVIGNPENAQYLVTAHYDTCAHLPFPNLLIPCNLLAFLSYQIAMVIILLTLVIAVQVVLYSVTNNPDLSSNISCIMMLGLAVLMMIGPANKYNANDNTSGVVTVLEIAKYLPESFRDKVCFVLFDLEEAGLIGSASYRKKHKRATQNQMVLNLDCVGDGDEIVLFPTKKLRKASDKLNLIEKSCVKVGKKSITIRKEGFAIYPSDQANFPYGVGIAAFRRNRWPGLYLGRIHTNRDTILEKENVNILRDCMIDLIGSTGSE